MSRIFKLCRRNNFVDHFFNDHHHNRWNLMKQFERNIHTDFFRPYNKDVFHEQSNVSDKIFKDLETNFDSFFKEAKYLFNHDHYFPEKNTKEYKELQEKFSSEYNKIKEKYTSDYQSLEKQYLKEYENIVKTQREAYIEKQKQKKQAESELHKTSSNNNLNASDKSKSTQEIKSQVENSEKATNNQEPSQKYSYFYESTKTYNNSAISKQTTEKKIKNVDGKEVEEITYTQYNADGSKEVHEIIKDSNGEKEKIIKYDAQGQKINQLQ